MRLRVSVGAKAVGSCLDLLQGRRDSMWMCNIWVYLNSDAGLDDHWHLLFKAFVGIVAHACSIEHQTKDHVQSSVPLGSEPIKTCSSAEVYKAISM